MHLFYGQLQTLLLQRTPLWLLNNLHMKKQTPFVVDMERNDFVQISPNPYYFFFFLADVHVDCRGSGLGQHHTQQ